jgi:hypothetical protein
MEQISTTGSERGVSPTTAQREQIKSWAHEVPLDEASTSAANFHPLEQVDFENTETPHLGRAPDKDRGQLPAIVINISAMSTDHIEVRSKLIRDGLVEYSRSAYEIARRCLKEAYDMGTVAVQHSSAGIIADETLRLWLSLVAARLIQNAENPKKASQNLQSSIEWDYSELQRQRIVSVQECGDASESANTSIYRRHRPSKHSLR